MSLDKMVEQLEKTMVISDLHGEFLDKDAFAIATEYMKDYKPDNLIINGDMLDFYGLSYWDKNPERKTSFMDEIKIGRRIIHDLRESAGKDCKIVYIEGNHENRLQKRIWKSPEFSEVTQLRLENLMGLSDYKVEFIGVDNDYWRQTNGHYIIGDAIITHGDNRTNGASTSQYAGYSAKNTMLNMQRSVVLGHVHRLAIVNHASPYGTLTGVEAGCLCQKTGTANWMQGFVTFETVDSKKNVNYRIHEINKGVMYADGIKYEVK